MNCLPITTKLSTSHIEAWYNRQRFHPSVIFYAPAPSGRSESRTPNVPLYTPLAPLQCTHEYSFWWMTLHPFMWDAACERNQSLHFGSLPRSGYKATTSEPEMLDKILYWSGRTAVDWYTRLMLAMDVVWQAPLPHGPKIIASNHPTTTDPFYLLALVPEQISILITEMCFKIPVFGRYLRMAGHIPVVQDKGREAFEQARQQLAAGRAIGIFPEGYLSPQNGGLCKPRTGAARLSLLTGAPIIPVGIYLQRERIRHVDTTVDDMSEVARWYLNGPYTVTVGGPMHFDGDVEDWEFVGSVSERIMQRIGQLARQSARRLRRSQAAPSLTDSGEFAIIRSEVCNG